MRIRSVPVSFDRSCHSFEYGYRWPWGDGRFERGTGPVLIGQLIETHLQGGRRGEDGGEAYEQGEDGGGCRGDPHWGPASVWQHPGYTSFRGKQPRRQVQHEERTNGRPGEGEIVELVPTCRAGGEVPGYATLFLSGHFAIEIHREKLARMRHCNRSFNILRPRCIRLRTVPMGAAT